MNTNPRSAFHSMTLAVWAAIFAAAGLAAIAQEPPAAGAPTQPGAATNAPVAEPQTQVTAAPDSAANGTNGLNLNFRNASIDLVLERLSEAAGFVIVMETPVRGSMTVIGKNLTREEAVNLLNSELNKNGYAA